MANKKCLIVSLVCFGLVVAAGISVLIAWIVKITRPDFELIHLDGKGIGDVSQHFAYARMQRGAHTFWWFYPTIANVPTPQSRPIIIWIDGILGLSPSLLANFGMFGPYDFDLKKREDSWINDYNLLFIDSPVGTGFSFFNRDNQAATSPEQYADDLFFTIQSFYAAHEEYKSSPVYIFGQGHGAKQTVALVIRMQEDIKGNEIEINLKGIVLGGAIISPALVLTKLGFYLEELAYIDGNGRETIEKFTSEILALVEEGQYENALTQFINLEEFINEEAGAIAVNIHHIVEKLTRDPIIEGYFGQKNHLRSKLMTDINFNIFMDETVGPALGINSGVRYDSLHDTVVDAAKSTLMISDIEKVENILENTNIIIHIYNGNLDALSNTPGQLEWVNNLRWSGQSEFLASPRTLIAINRQLEGYVRETERLHFYWINVAGHSAPLDSPIAMREVLRRIAGY